MAIGPYKVVYIEIRDYHAGMDVYAKEMEQTINRWAVQGWEFVHSTQDGGQSYGMFLYFKKHNDGKR
jgi:hypothetical protein